MTLAPEYTAYIEPIFQRKPLSVTALKVTDLTSYADVVVIVEAGSRRQVTSLAEHVIKTLKGKKIKALGAEGIKEGEWALLDFGDLIIHVFESDAKGFYDLEGLWSDAPRIDLAAFGELKAATSDPWEGDDDGF